MKILLVSSRFPLPPWRGNQLRTLQWLEALDDAEIMLVCPAADGESSDMEIGADLAPIPRGRLAAARGLATAVVRGRPAQEGLYATAAAADTVATALREWRPDVVVAQMVRCGWAADLVASETPGVPVIFDAIDCMGMHYRRAADRAMPGLRWAYRLEAERCVRRETGLVRAAALTTAVSARDLESLGAGERGAVVTVTGGSEMRREPDRGDPPTILMSGNLGYAPTVRGASWFASEVWPGLRDRVPGARWVLAGARPAPAVRRLAAREGVEVHGDVETMEPFLSRAAVAVAPMASGSGVPVKILEAMAAGVPVVADPWAASGLADASAVRVAESAAQWVDAVHGLLTDRAAAREQSRRGRDAWRAAYHPSVVRDQVRRAVETVASRTG